MLYRIDLDDNSFFIVNGDYEITIFYLSIKKTITVEEYMQRKNKYSKYVMIDVINYKKIKRTFTITETDNKENYKIGVRLKLSQHIKENDILVGPDNKPRVVSELHNGEDEMYEIEVNGEKYTVNGGHILALVDKETNERLEIPVNVYMHFDDEFKSHYAMEVVNF